MSNNEDLGIDLTNFSKEEEIAKFKAFKPQGWTILVRLYTKPKKVNGLIMPDKTHDEQHYFVCTGLVVRKSKGAYKDSRYEQTGKWCKVGDWVVFPKAAGYKVTIDGMPCYVLKEDAIDLIIPDPIRVNK
jgi:co-chaperonin GroES (HSP10)